MAGAPGLRVVVIGGGAAGALTAVALLRNDRKVTVQVVERRETIGPGLAYSTSDPLHVLNNFAGRLSALDDDPDHFVRWCQDHDLPVGPDSFAPRSLYGWYLADVLGQTEAAAPGRLHRVTGDAIDVGDTGGEYVVTLASGHVLAADAVVLAPGNPPPRRVLDYESHGRRYIADPWCSDVVDRVADGSRVLLVGSGLTMIDVALRLASSRRGVTLVSVSRHGLLPARHARRGPRVLEPVSTDGAGLSRVLREVRQRIDSVETEGGDWRDVIDGVRVVANDLWREWSSADRERFLRHVARWWEIARHRMAPEIADQVDRLRRGGRLQVCLPDTLSGEQYDVVINCAGPAPVATPGWNLLIDHLVVRGSAVPDRLGLGLDVDEHGALIGDNGVARGIFAVGVARRGDEWEVAAVPDLRRQVTALAAHLSPASYSAVEAAG